mmetsp:Transcript_22495/g.54407  ORF Transcript_22495/g.54407 Transcript_22495/m.54407 type:complete len:379 (-) Transcript_22495:304-1440(-)|eukprot:CAMPEP_0181092356 /NCGR_PEP_ID=MMETSP1071-20121207/8877_1 /TAXON_ID=35127 /ORGANISM="Thalassiosira sp., Strain NH16" /LENGTH=378 /DNA_ID=CAMNT_0023174535 /DNA_START=87 /DNA_END=1223 /DNA_ORIENTATION=+
METTLPQKKKAKVDNVQHTTNTNTTKNNHTVTKNGAYSDNKSMTMENRKRRGGTKDNGDRSRFRTQQSQTKVICAQSTSEFEMCISKCVNEGDTVLIINGGTDKGSKSYDGGEEKARQTSKREPTVFRGTSVWENVHELIQLATTCAPAVRVICLEPSNLHGNDLILDSIALIKLLRSIFSTTTTHTTILVKSKLLARHARSYHNVHDFINSGGMTNASLVKNGNGAVQVVSAVGVESYRDTIPLVVRQDDHVLEIGCHHGKTTSLIAKATQRRGTVVGVDIGKVCIERAKKNYSELGIRFEVADAWDSAALLDLDPAFTAIYLDVGGISGADGLFEALGLVRQLTCAYKSSLRCIVVKSRCLRDHSLVYKNSDEFLR